MRLVRQVVFHSETSFTCLDELYPHDLCIQKVKLSAGLDKQMWMKLI